ncbi:MAG: TonB-dependent receptor, partial [Bacteroidetes bacterium HGW-Bacteroidetes-22]
KLERRNGPGATVAGLNLEGKLLPARWLQIQVGFTFQKSTYEEAVKWSEDPDTEPAEKMLRSPETYGYMTTQLNASKRWAISFSGIYTGSMDVPHYAGYITKDELVHTSKFFDMGLKIAYTSPLDGTMSIQFYSGVRNMLNNFQSDFDIGENRDSKYIYGPREPETIYFGIRLNYE